MFLAANFIPSIWDAFQFTGATAAVCIRFIFPAAITLRICMASPQDGMKVMLSLSSTRTMPHLCREILWSSVQCMYVSYHHLLLLENCIYLYSPFIGRGL